MNNSYIKYPVLMSWDDSKRFKNDYEKYVPYGLLLPHEKQAKQNHGQSLERSKERGGLDYTEMLAIIEDRKWFPVPKDVSRAKVLIYVLEYLEKQSDLPPYWDKVKDTIYELCTMLGVDTW